MTSSQHNCRNKLQKQTEVEEDDSSRAISSSCNKCCSESSESQIPESVGGGESGESNNSSGIDMTAPPESNQNSRRQQLNRTPAVSMEESSSPMVDLDMASIPPENHEQFPYLVRELQELRAQLSEFLSMRFKGEEVHDTVKDDMIKFMENVFTDPAKVKDKTTLLACYDYLQNKSNGLLNPASEACETRFLDDDPRTRMLMHKLCAFLGLDHNIVGPHQKDTMIIQRKETNFRNWNFTLPDLCRFFSLVDFLTQPQHPNIGAVAGLPDDSEGKQILRRFEQLEVEQEQGACVENKVAAVNKSLDERKREYERKKSEIFKSQGGGRMHNKYCRNYHSQPTRDDSMSGKHSPAGSLRRYNTDNTGEMTASVQQQQQALMAHSTLEVPPNRGMIVTRQMPSVPCAPSNNSSMDDSGMYSPQSGSPCPGQQVQLYEETVVWRLCQVRVADLCDGDWVFYGPHRYPAQLVRQDGSPYTHQTDIHSPVRVAFIPTSRAATPVNCITGVKLRVHTPPPAPPPAPMTPQFYPAPPPPPPQHMQLVTQSPLPPSAPMMVPLGVQQSTLRHSASLDSISGVGYMPPPAHGYPQQPTIHQQQPHAQYSAMPQPMYQTMMSSVPTRGPGCPQGYATYMSAPPPMSMGVGVPMLPVQALQHGASTT